MDKTVDALRKLYNALGGEMEQVEDLVLIPDLINKIAEQVRANKLAEAESA